MRLRRRPIAPTGSSGTRIRARGSTARRKRAPRSRGPCTGPRPRRRRRGCRSSLRPRPRFGGSGLLRRLTLPEWLTAGVGGYAREHPAAIAFSVLIGAAVLTVGAMGWERQEGWLTREVQESEAPPASTVRVATRVSATVADWRRRRVEPAASPSNGASPKRSTSAQPMAPNAGAVRRAPTANLRRRAVRPRRPSRGRGRAAAADDSDARLGRSHRRGNDPCAGAEPAVRRRRARASTDVARDSRAGAGAGEREDRARSAARTASCRRRRCGSASGAVLAHAPAVASASGSVAPVGAPSARAEQAAPVTVPAVPPSPPATTEIEALFATFVETYERGRIDAFVALVRRRRRQPTSATAGRRYAANTTSCSACPNGARCS